jgi:hypothetical protein
VPEIQVGFSTVSTTSTMAPSRRRRASFTGETLLVDEGDAFAAGFGRVHYLIAQDSGSDEVVIVEVVGVVRVI